MVTMIKKVNIKNTAKNVLCAICRIRPVTIDKILCDQVLLN